MEAFRARYEQYLEALAREHYRFRSGQKATLELEPIDDRFGELVAGATLESLGREHERATFADAREGWRRLLLAARAQAAAARLRPLARALREREAAARARVGDQEHTLFAWQARLGAIEDREQRRRVQEALDRGADELDERRREHWMRHGEELAKSGHATPRAWAEALHPGVDYERWGREATRLLEATESAYREGLRRALERMRVPVEQADRADAARVGRLVEFDRWFPGGGMGSCLDFTTDGMGIRLAATPGVVVDDAERPGKHPRASCIAPRVPGEVYVLLAPRGGLDDYETLFHEAGHALHHAYTSPALPIERRALGDPALTETWAFLLHYRVSDPEWIRSGPAAARAEEFGAAVRFRKLALLRRYAGKIRYELELNALPAGADPRPLAGRYAEELTAATGFRYRPSQYLADTDMAFYSVDYFRAWCLEVRLAEHLRQRFGRAFWRARRAGELLKELWNTGTTYSADGLSDALGLGPIEVEPLVRELLGGRA
jgi:hypothetical protein